MNRFETETNEWSAERLAAFLQDRVRLMTSGPANLLDVGSTRINRAFAGTRYEELERRALTYERWQRVHPRSPSELIDPDPFAKSPYREGGYRSWDAAVRIPDSAWRNSEPERLYDLRSIRSCNSQWMTEIYPALRRPMPYPIQERIEISAPFTFDLQSMENGLEVLETAHVLTHLRGDRLLASSAQKPTDPPALAKLFQRSVAEVIVALAYDLPLDVSDRPVSDYGDTNLPLGISVSSSVWSPNPKLTVAYDGPAMLQLDKTLAVVDVGMVVRGHPQAFDDGTGCHTAGDRFGCMPCLVYIAGWETPEVILHWLIAQSYSDGPRFPAMSPEDLMTPDTFWAYLALGKLHEGAPTSDDNWKRPPDWMNSNEYLQAYMRTPPLPCKHCLELNKRAEYAPQRPRRPPRGGRWVRDREWKMYVDCVRRIMKIVDGAVVEHEGRRYGGSATARRIRTERRRRYAAHMATLKDDVWLEEMQRKSREGHTRTVRQERRFRRLVAEHQQGPAASQDGKKGDWDVENRAWI